MSDDIFFFISNVIMSILVKEINHAASEKPQNYLINVLDYCAMFATCSMKRE